MRYPKGKFKLEHISVRLDNGHHDWKYIVILNGKFSHVWCDSKLRSKDKALKHFWRWIGES